MLEDTGTAGATQARKQFLDTLEDALQHIFIQVDARHRKVEANVRGAWGEFRSATEDFLHEVGVLKAQVSSPEFIDSVHAAWGQFMRTAMIMLRQDKTMSNALESVNRWLDLWHRTTQIITAVVLGIFGLIPTFLLLQVPVGSGGVGRQFAVLRAVTAVAITGVIFLYVIFVLPMPSFWQQTQCPTVLHIIAPESNDPGSPLIVDNFALNALRGVPGPVWVFSESGPFNVGKSTTLSALLYMLLGRQSRPCVRSILRARTGNDAQVAGGMTRGIWMVVVPRRTVDIDSLPRSAQAAFAQYVADSVLGSIVFVDTQGTESGTEQAGESEMLELLAVMMSSHHTFARVSRFHDKPGMGNLAKIGSMLDMVDLLSSPGAGCVGWSGVTFHRTSRADVTIRVKDGRGTGSLMLVTCLHLDATNTEVVAIPPNCSLRVPVVQNDFTSGMLPSELTVLQRYFTHTSALIQPPPEKGELLSMWTLQASYNGTSAADPGAFATVTSRGIMHSLAVHHLPHLLASSPKSVDGKLLDGDGLAVLLAGTFDALLAVSRANINLFAVTNQQAFHSALKDVMQNMLLAWHNSSNTSPRVRNVQHTPRGKLKAEPQVLADVFALLPLEKSTCSGATTAEDLCPESLADAAFNKSADVLLRGLCLFRPLLDTETLRSIDATTAAVLNASHALVLQKQRELCHFQWVNGEWSSCTGRCNGKQERHVHCMAGSDLSDASARRDDVCCAVFTGAIKQTERDCDPPAYTYQWITTPWPQHCENPTPCLPAANPESALVPAGLVAGVNTRSYKCQRCGRDLVDDSQCDSALGAKPSDELRRCYPDQVFYTSRGWSPSVCECGSTQINDLSCENCYGDHLPLATCQQSALNKATTVRACEGHQWGIAGRTQCTGECGTQNDDVACKTCTNVHADAAACKGRQMPPISVYPCLQKYRWAADPWPQDCACGTAVVREVHCINSCTNAHVEPYHCAHEPRPAAACACHACPTRRFCCSSFFGVCMGRCTETDSGARHRTPC